MVAEGLSAFSLNEAREAAKASPPAPAAADIKERPAAALDEKNAPLGGDGDDVKEVDVAEVQAQAREIAAAQAPQVSEEDMRDMEVEETGEEGSGDLKMSMGEKN